MKTAYGLAIAILTCLLFVAVLDEVRWQVQQTQVGRDKR